MSLVKSVVLLLLLFFEFYPLFVFQLYVFLFNPLHFPLHYSLYSFHSTPILIKVNCVILPCSAFTSISSYVTTQRNFLERNFRVCQVLFYKLCNTEYHVHFIIVLCFQFSIFIKNKNSGSFWYFFYFQYSVFKKFINQNIKVT